MPETTKSTKIVIALTVFTMAATIFVWSIPEKMTAAYRNGVAEGRQKATIIVGDPCQIACGFYDHALSDEQSEALLKGTTTCWIVGGAAGTDRP